MVKNPPTSARDIREASLIPGFGRSPGGGHSNPLQYSCLGNPIGRGAQQATVRRVTESETQLIMIKMLPWDERRILSMPASQLMSGS